MFLAAVVAVLVVAGGLAYLRLDSDDGSTPSGSPLSAPVVTVTGTPPPSTTSTDSPASSSSFEGIYADVESGVALVEVRACGQAFAGTAFLVDDDTLVTAAHVIEGATEISVDFGQGPLSAELVGINAASDLAVLSLPAPVPYHHFDVEASDPAPGSEVAVIGFPLSEPKSLTVGTISGLGRRITTESGTYEGLLQTDAAINPGNSGGPLLNAEGDVVGVADAIRADAQGIGFAVPISQVRTAVTSEAALSQPTPPSCDPATAQPTTADVEEGVEEGVSATLHRYLEAISVGDYHLAMQQLSAAMRAKTSLAQWYDDYWTTVDDRLEIRSIDGPDARPRVWATFRSRQDPGFGPAGAEDATCLLWSVDYQMTKRQTRWIISGAGGHGDKAWTRCG